MAVGWWAEFFASIQAASKKASASFLAVQYQEARIVVELQRAVAAMVGREHPKGSFQAELKKGEASLSGTPIQRGDVAAVAQKATASLQGVSMSGFLLPQGPFTGVFQKVQAAFTGQHTQRGSFTGTGVKASATLLGQHIQRGTLAAAAMKPQATLTGKQTQQGAIAAIAAKATASMNGQFTGVTPVAIDVVGTPGTETISSGGLSCTISPTAGADVLCFASTGARYLYGATYSVGSVKMKVLGRVRHGAGQMTVFLAKGVSSGSATITIDTSGSGDWMQCVAISYTGAVDWKFAKTVIGSGVSVSQSASPGSNGLAVQSFANGDDAKPFSSLSGGTARLNEATSFVCLTIRDIDISGTFSANQSSSNAWGGIVCEATPSAISGPKINNSGAQWSEVLGGSNSFTVNAAVNDYIVVDIVQDRAGNPSSVTCDGAAMTLMDTQTFTSGVGTGFIKRYRTSSAMGSAGNKTIAITSTGSGWWHAAGCSISNVTSFGTPTKASGTSSAPSHNVTCSAGQLILQSFATAVNATSITGANLFDSPGGGNSFLYMNVATETTTFGISNSINWASMATVIS